jgi:hypothetical protein
VRSGKPGRGHFIPDRCGSIMKSSRRRHDFAQRFPNGAVSDFEIESDLELFRRECVAEITQICNGAAPLPPRT